MTFSGMKSPPLPSSVCSDLVYTEHLLGAVWARRPRTPASGQDILAGRAGHQEVNKGVKQF